MRSIRDLDLHGRRVFIRVDFNVPLDEARNITDDLRIRTALPTIRHVLEQGGKAVLCSHLGRPKGERRPEFSLAPVAAHLGTLLGREVTLAPDCVGAEVRRLTEALEPGEALLLENVRFHAGEQANDPAFADALAATADVYVNDAFAVSHRAHASVVGVPQRLADKAAGLLLERELQMFHQAMDTPVRPLVAVVGGAKVSSKLGALENMLGKVDRMLIGGAMANTFLKCRGVDVGASKVEEDLLDTAARFLDQAATRGVQVHLPVDVVAAAAFAPDAPAMEVPVEAIPAGWIAVDIGPATARLFAEVLAMAKTIVWNGPMGAFEMDRFAAGTMSVAHRMAISHALTISGGGDTNSAVKKAGVAAQFSYMSTGGGAFLRLMEGKDLPGVTALG